MITGIHNNPERNQEDFIPKLKERFSKWFYETPAVTRILIFVSAAGMILAVFGLEQFLGENSPVNTVLRVQIWRPFTSGFIGSNIVSDLFAILAIYQVCCILEPKKGSTFLLLTAVVSTVFIQVATVILLTLVGISLFPRLLFISGGGFWPVAFVLIALESKTSSNTTRQLMCFPVEVPTKYYAAILAVIFFIISGLRAVDIFMGLGLGYLLGAFSQLQFSTALCQFIESQAPMKTFIELQGYITIQGIGFLMQPGQTSQEMRHFGSVFNADANLKPAGFKPFSGVGHKLGTGSPTILPSSQYEGETTQYFRGHPLAEKYSALPAAIEVPIKDVENRNSSVSNENIPQDYLV